MSLYKSPGKVPSYRWEGLSAKPILRSFAGRVPHRERCLSTHHQHAASGHHEEHGRVAVCVEALSGLVVFLTSSLFAAHIQIHMQPAGSGR